MVSEVTMVGERKDRESTLILNYLGLEVTQITDTQGDWSELATQPQSNGKGSWDI